MKSRREFLQLAAVTAALVGSRSFNSVAAKQSLTQDSLLEFNSKGQVTTYKSIGIVNLTIERDGKLEKTQSFNEDFTYNSYDNKFDLVEYQEEVETIIINKIIEKINIYLNL